MKYALLTTLITFNLLAATCPENRTDYFCKPVEKNESKEISVTEFYLIPAQIMGLYNAKLQSLNLPVTLDADWNSPYFGAGVSLNENAYHLMILGGMARMKEMTKDGYAAIVCHELGHMLGGAPHQTITGADWASAEGQADFFAASECLPKYFKQQGLNDVGLINKQVEKAGFDFLSLARVVETTTLGKSLVRAKVNMPVVSETIINRYPTTQCRYETYRNNSTRPTCWYKD